MLLVGDLSTIFCSAYYQPIMASDQSRHMEGQLKSRYHVIDASHGTLSA